MSENQLSPQRLNQLVWGFSIPIMIDAAVHSGVFDALDKSPKTAQQLATETKTDVRALTMVMNALIGFDLLARNGDAYSLTPESAAFLVRGKPAFQGGLLGHLTNQILPKWSQLRDVVKTGKPAMAVNQQDAGSEFFAQFVEDIFPMSYAAARVLGEALSKELEGPGAVKVLDIAAGSGVWGIALAQKSKAVEVTAVDWEGVVPVTKKVATKYGVGDRLKTIAGDLMTADYGTGYRVATLGHILHSEGEARSRKLLKKVFDALAPGGTIVISEFVVNEDRKGPPGALIFAVNMLVNTDVGNTFTFKEIDSWLKEAGFAPAKSLEAPAPSPLILAKKPG